MNTLIVYFSKFGNTRMVAEAIAEELELNGDVRLISSEDLSPEDFQSVGLVLMGTPTHNMNLPKPVKPVFERLTRNMLKNTSIAAFDTSYKMSTILSKFTAAKRLNRKLRKLGGNSVIAPMTFHVEGREGPLYPGEIKRAQEWAGRICERVNGKEAK